MTLEIDNLVRHFGGVRAVDGISLSLAAGDVMGFVGPNGAGKTTTLRIVATLDDATGGDVRLSGTSLLDYPEEARRLVGFMPDALPEHGDITAHEYVDFFGRAFGLRGAALRRAVEEVSEFAGIGPIRGKTLRSLSKGMKQRVSLARAMIHDPAVMVMDEPANGLDPRARIELRELVRALAERGKAILISSHILTELDEMCTSVAIIEKGLLVGSGDVASLANEGRSTRRVAMRPLSPDPAQVQAILLETPGVVGAIRSGPRFVVEMTGTSEEDAADLLAVLTGRGVRIAEFGLEESGLEDVFMKITKGDLA